MFKNPLVVGYKGEIGSFILNGLLKVMPKAGNIWCFDINETEKEKIERIKKSDCIFLCVPVQDTVKWLVKYKKHLKNKIIVEQASLKEWIYKDKRINKLQLVPIHILFRPSVTPNKNDRTVILIKDEMLKTHHYFHEKDILIFRDLIENITDSIVITCQDIKQHDILMAIKQGVLHKVLLALSETLNLGYGNTETFLSRQILNLTERIKTGDKELYKFIQTNKYLPEIMKVFKKELNRRNIY